MKQEAPSGGCSLKKATQTDLHPCSPPKTNTLLGNPGNIFNPEAPEAPLRTVHGSMARETVSSHGAVPFPTAFCPNVPGLVIHLADFDESWARGSPGVTLGARE